MSQINVIDEVFDLKKIKNNLIVGNVFDKETLIRLTEYEILKRYKISGEKFVHSIQGNFIIFLIDKEYLYIFNDRYGLKHLYYCFENGCFLVSSYFGRFTNYFKTNEIDKEALLEFNLFKYPFGDKTLLKNVKLLPPACIIKIDLSMKKYQTSVYHKFDLSHTDGRNSDEILRDLIKNINKSVDLVNNTAGSKILPLSGGLDSRYLAALMKERGINFNAYTYGKRFCDDQKYATRVTKLLKINHYHEYMENNEKLEKYSKLIFRLHGNMYPKTKVCDSGIISEDINGELIVSGLSGDMIFGSRFDPSILNFKHKKDIILYLFNKDCSENYLVPRYKFGKYYYFYLLSGKNKINSLELYSDELMDKVFENYTQEFDKYYDPKNPVKSIFLFDIFNRQRRWIFNIVNTSGKNHLCPFYEYNLFDFVLTIPDILWINRVIYKYSFVCKFPELSKIPEQRTRLPINVPEWIGNLNEYKLKISLV